MMGHDEIFCISSLKMSFHYDKYWQILIEIKEYMILTEIIQGLEETSNSLILFIDIFCLSVWLFCRLIINCRLWNGLHRIVKYILKYEIFLCISNEVWKKKAARTVVWAQKIHLLKTGVGGVVVFSLYILLWEYSKYREQFNITGGWNRYTFI